MSRRRFAVVPLAITLDPSLSRNDLRLAGLLLHYQGRKANSWPRIETMAKELGSTERTVYRSLSALRSSGWLTIEKEGRRNLYAMAVSDQETPDRHLTPVSCVTEQHLTFSSVFERSHLLPLQDKGEGVRGALPGDVAMEAYGAAVERGGGVAPALRSEDRPVLVQIEEMAGRWVAKRAGTLEERIGRWAADFVEGRRAKAKQTGRRLYLDIPYWRDECARAVANGGEIPGAESLPGAQPRALVHTPTPKQQAELEALNRSLDAEADRFLKGARA